MSSRPLESVLPVFSLPPEHASAWVVETTPEATRKWIAGLPLTDSAFTAQQIYQALFTLNRMALDPIERLALMELYRAPVTAASNGLQSYFAHFSLPLRPRQKQLADFLVQLHMEMAYGYKHVVGAGLGQRRPWEGKTLLLAIERAIHYLGEVLLHAYQVYMPFPAGVWKETHGLYRYAEEHARQQLPVDGDATIARTYMRVLMLGLCSPYQLLQNECQQVNAFLARWAHKAELTPGVEGVEPVGHFLLDLDADHAAVPFPRDVPLRNAPGLRAVNAIELARVAHDFIAQLLKDVSPQQLELGFDCLGSGCVDTLKRMLRFWGVAGRRHFSRRRLHKSLSLCVGLNAIHFFIDGQRPFTSPHTPAVAPQREAVAPGRAQLDAEVVSARADDAAVSGEIFRVDSRWQVRDESASGLALARVGDVGLPMRVGDLLGIQSPDTNQWRIGAVRWVKSPDTQRVELGVEMLAPSAQPLAVRPAGVMDAPYSRALLLPPIEVLRQPATLLVPRGAWSPGQDIDLAEGEHAVRHVRILDIVERTGAFSQIVFADVARS